MTLETRLDAYLRGPRFTLWTFIKYHEKSKDPAHCRRLRKKMRAALDCLHREGKVIRCRSIKGGVSWKLAPSGVPF